MSVLPQIGDIIEGHSGYRDPPTDDLNGKTLAIRFEGEAPADYVFAADGKLKLLGGEARYEAFQVAEGLYFIDVSDARDADYVLILDLNRQCVLEVSVIAPSIEAALEGAAMRMERTGSLSAVQTRYRLGAISAQSAPQAFPRTGALTGKRVLCTYSATHVYDHIYVSDSKYVWFCVSGPDAGLGDFEECDYFELAPEIFLVSWRETLLPMGGITVENYKTMRSAGTIFGLDVHTGKKTKATVGAHMTLLPAVDYAAKPAPGKP